MLKRLIQHVRRKIFNIIFYHMLTRCINSRPRDIFVISEQKLHANLDWHGKQNGATKRNTVLRISSTSEKPILLGNRMSCIYTDVASFRAAGGSLTPGWTIYKLFRDSRDSREIKHNAIDRNIRGNILLLRQRGYLPQHADSGWWLIQVEWIVLWATIHFTFIANQGSTILFYSWQLTADSIISFEKIYIYLYPLHAFVLVNQWRNAFNLEQYIAIKIW